jgi:HAE1 family hydrophobic/amphiphilic exporter-1/multidrug efflux pump
MTFTSRKKSILKKINKVFGPGLITGASDDDPSGIATYSQAGAVFGLNTLWTAVLTFPLMAALQEMCARIGLVTKNGILIVEFANQKREHGMSKKDAVIEAASQRLRPILMTSLATALGALPIALSLGDASTSRIPLGIVIVGGIMFSLILTLFVIPAIYTFISGKHEAKPTIISD